MAKPENEITWKDLNVGFVVDEPGNASVYRTGDWRSQRPLYNRERCIRCGTCYIYCPDMAIKILEDGYIEHDLYYCKGCGICVQECPTGAITMVEEEEKDGD
ncbi:MAG: pyruvate synthase subunit PorD [Deltaproteobacteria bacterium]|nr:MAG: pyruvate synthase subunit PorD [Deltaproteobacteria bacterium]